ncbi:hypothetical protein [Mycolicibacterium tusciae]|uniref:hypothetical protein n=1 Tax=Mycolicibacterium tusciae TaxID=75922 RepID=UPI0011E581D3|nr:hypothetical protein [Mycolicibacterium tusciae]
MAVVGSSDEDRSARPPTVDSSGSPGVDSSEGIDLPQSNRSPETPKSSMPPRLVVAPDSYGETCGDGFHVTGRSGWATNAGRGSVETSCSFALSVLFASVPHTQHRTSDGDGVGKGSMSQYWGRCVGYAFVMDCAAIGNEPWITCTGGRNARAYIY